MLYTAKTAVCSQIHTKHRTQSEHHVEFLNVKPGGTPYVKKPLGFKGLMFHFKIFSLSFGKRNILQLTTATIDCLGLRQR